MSSLFLIDFKISFYHWFFEPIKQYSRLYKKFFKDAYKKYPDCAAWRSFSGPISLWAMITVMGHKYHTVPGWLPASLGRKPHRQSHEKLSGLGNWWCRYSHSLRE